MQFALNNAASNASSLSLEQTSHLGDGAAACGGGSGGGGSGGEGCIDCMANMNIRDPGVGSQDFGLVAGAGVATASHGTAAGDGP